MGIMKTLRQDLFKLVLITAWDQENTACGNLRMYAVLEAGIEEETNSLGKRSRKRGKR